MACRKDAPRRAWPALRFGEMAEDVFHHDDGGIDDDAEVDRAHRQQVGRFAAQHENDDGEHQGEGNGRGHDDGAAQVAEENPLDDEDEATPSTMLCSTVLVVTSTRARRS